MNVRFSFLLLLALTAAAPTRARAEVHASLRPDEARGPFHQVLTLVADGEDVDVVFDRRLLRFSVHAEGRRRPLRCTHPAAPRRVVETRITHIDSSHPRVEEWLDLRMYCTGRALAALTAGGLVTARYGFRRPGRGRWVVRTPDARPVAELPLDDFSLPAQAEEAAPEADVLVHLRSGTVHVGHSPSFRVSLHSSAGSKLVYPHDDLYRFVIQGPLGEVECGPERRPLNPIVDFFRRIGTRRGSSGHVDGSSACPGALDVAGVYEVKPLVDLIYDGERYGLDVTTGTFEGPPAIFRVVGRSYVEHPLDESGTP